MPFSPFLCLSCIVLTRDFTHLSSFLLAAMNIKLRDEYAFIIDEIRKVSLQPLPETSDAAVHAAVVASAAAAADASASAAAAMLELEKVRSELERVRVSAAASDAAAAAANEARAEMECEPTTLNPLLHLSFTPSASSSLTLHQPKSLQQPRSLRTKQSLPSLLRARLRLLPSTLLLPYPNPFPPPRFFPLSLLASPFPRFKV